MGGGKGPIWPNYGPKITKINLLTTYKLTGPVGKWGVLGGGKFTWNYVKNDLQITKFR